MILTLSIINIILVLLLLILFNKGFLDYISNICKTTGTFIKENSGFFTMVFLFLFFIEQLMLIVGVFLFDVSPLLQTFIGVFALIVVTTATLQKFIWEYKYNYAKNSLKEIIGGIKNLSIKYKYKKQKKFY